MNLISKIVLIVLSIGFTACEPIEKVGPSICAGEKFILQKEDVKLFRVSSDSIEKISEGDIIQLDTSGLKIQADFGHDLFWELKITNGSFEKNYSGKDSSISIFWYGQPDKFDGTNLSMPEGDITVDLKIVCQDVISQKIKIKGKQKFKGIDSSFGMLIRDFDKNGVKPVMSDEYIIFDGQIDWSTLNIKDSNKVEYTNIEPSPSGNNYISLEAYQESLSWYFGVFELNIKSFFDSLPNVLPEDMYLNFFVKRTLEIPNIPANLGIKTVDGNMMLYNEEINWDGWKLISVSFAEFEDTKTSGRLSDLTGVEWFVLNLGAFPMQSSSTGICYDMFLITVDKPLFE